MSTCVVHEVPTPTELRSIADPRERLVHAGARLLADGAFDILVRGLSPDAVTQVADRTRRVFYDHFATREAFARAVFAPYLDTDDHPVLGAGFVDAFEDLILEADGELVASVRALTEAFFSADDRSAAPRLRAIAWAMAGTDPTIRDQLDEYYRRVDDLYGAIIEQSLSAWGQKVRTPWSPRLLATMLQVLTDGMYARNQVRPGTVDHEFFASCLLAIFGATLQDANEPDESIDRTLNRISRPQGPGRRSDPGPPTVTNTRQLVLNALEPLLRLKGPEAVTLRDIADRAGVGLTMVSRAFGSVANVIDEAVLSSLPALTREVEFDLATHSLTTRAILTRHLTRLSTWAGNHPELALAMAGISLTEPPDESDNGWVPRRLAAPAILILDQAQNAGELREGSDPVRTAWIATHAALNPGLANRDPAPEATATWIVSFLFDGIAGPDQP